MMLRKVFLKTEKSSSLPVSVGAKVFNFEL